MEFNHVVSHFFCETLKSVFAFLQSTVIFQIDSKSSGTRYYLSFNSDRRTLFVSFPNEKTVIGKQMNLDTTDAAEGWFVLAGNGKPCLGNKPCGDGGLAVEAHLAFPKVSF